VNDAVVAAKLDALTIVLAKLERKRPDSLAVLLADDDLQDIVVLNLARAVQIAVDIGTTLIADTDIEPPGSMRAVFARLDTLGIIDGGTADRLKLAVGFRNLAIHRYESLDWSVVLEACRIAPSDLRTFAREVAARTL